MNKKNYLSIVSIVLLLVVSAISILVSKELNFNFWMIILFFWVITIYKNVIYRILSKKNNEILEVSFIVNLGIFLVVDSILTILLSIFSNVINIKWILIINLLFIAVMLIVDFGLLLGNNHIAKVEGRQKNHHTKL